MAKENLQQEKQKTAKNSNPSFLAKYFETKDDGKRPMSVTIHKKTPAEVFGLLRSVDNFPLFFDGLEKVENKSETTADFYFNDRANVKGKFTVPMKVTYDESVSHSLLWMAEDSAGFSYSIAVEIIAAQGSRGTIVRMKVNYDNLAGEIAGMFEKLFGKDAEITTKKNLQRFKAFCETGHVPTTEGQPSGREEDQSPEMKH